MAGRNGLPIKVVFSSSTNLAGGANLCQSWPVTIRTFWLVFELVLPILSIVWAFLLSSLTFLHVVSDSEVERLQKIPWKKFELLQNFSRDMEICKMSTFYRVL